MDPKGFENISFQMTEGIPIVRLKKRLLKPRSRLEARAEFFQEITIIGNFIKCATCLYQAVSFTVIPMIR